MFVLVRVDNDYIDIYPYDRFEDAQMAMKDEYFAYHNDGERCYSRDNLECNSTEAFLERYYFKKGEMGTTCKTIKWKIEEI